MPITNTFRESLAAGEPVFGARASSYAPSLVEVYGSFELDFVRVDLERPGPSPWDSEYLETLTKTASLADVELLVRLPDSDPTTIRRVLGNRSTKPTDPSRRDGGRGQAGCPGIPVLLRRCPRQAKFLRMASD